MQINACILRPNASAQSRKNVFQTKKLPASINQINIKFALKAAVTGVDVQVLFAGFPTILLVNNLHSHLIFGAKLPESTFSCDKILTILLQTFIFGTFV